MQDGLRYMFKVPLQKGNNQSINQSINQTHKIILQMRNTTTLIPNTSKQVIIATLRKLFYGLANNI